MKNIEEFFKYDRNKDSTIIITKALNKNHLQELVIPDKIEGHSVTEIADEAFADCYMLRKVTLPENLNKIGKFAFYNCTKLETINLKSVEYIGRSAFQNCRLIRDIKLSPKLYYIDGWTFAGCSKLEKIIIGEGLNYIGHQAFVDCHNLATIEILQENKISLGYEVFLNINDKCKIKLPLFGNKENIFEDISQIQHFNFSEKLSYFSRENIFYSKRLTNSDELYAESCNTTYIDKASIPPKIKIDNKDYPVTQIGNKAFKGCDKLSFVDIPNTIDSIGDSAFANCPNMRLITVDKDNSRYYDDGKKTLISNNRDYREIIAYAIGNESESYTIQANIKKIKSYAFAGFKNLKNITFLSDTPPEIEIDAFRDGAVRECKVFVPKDKRDDYVKQLTKLGFVAENIFDSKKFQVDGIWYENISTEARQHIVKVSDNRNLMTDKIDIPSTVRFTDVDYTVIKIANPAFEDSSISYISIPSTIEEIDDDAFCNCNNLQIIYVATDNEKFCSEDGVLFNKNKTKLILYPTRKNTESYIIPTSVSEIASNAFSSCEYLKSITLPNSIRTINEYTFYRCFGLTSISLPNSVTTVCDNAFDGCRSLVSIHIPASVETIGSWDLTNYNNLKRITCKANIPPIAMWTGSINYASCTIIVPKGCREKYQKADGWSSFPNIIDKGMYFRHKGINYHILDFEAKTIEIQNNTNCKIPEVVIPATINIDGEDFTVVRVGERAFFNNNNKRDKIFSNNAIQKITLPNTIKDIAYKAFGSTDCIIESIPPFVEKIGDKAFYRINPDNRLTIPKSIKEINPKAFLFSNIGILQGESNDSFEIDKGVVINKKDKKLLYFASSDNHTRYTVPNTIQSINRHAFYLSNTLESIIIPPEVSTIEYAFWGCSSLSNMELLSKKPPKFTGSIHIDDDCTIIVPTGSLAAYIGHPDWKRFKNIKENPKTIPSSGTGGYGLSSIEVPKRTSRNQPNRKKTRRKGK